MRPWAALSPLVLALAVAALAASSVLANGVLTPQVTVSVESPVVSPTGEELTLEIDTHAWALPPGAMGEAGLSTDEPVLVRIVVPSSCQTLLEFVAPPGFSHVVRFENGDVVGGPQLDQNPVPGPAFRETVPTSCPLAALESSTGGDADYAWLIFVAGTAAVLLLAAGAFFLGRRPRQGA